MAKCFHDWNRIFPCCIMLQSVWTTLQGNKHHQFFLTTVLPTSRRGENGQKFIPVHFWWVSWWWQQWQKRKQLRVRLWWRTGQKLETFCLWYITVNVNYMTYNSNTSQAIIIKPLVEAGFKLVWNNVGHNGFGSGTQRSLKAKGQSNSGSFIFSYKEFLYFFNQT